MVCPYLQMADWLYAGPSAALSAWPTWVCVRPRDSRRILNALANSRISSRLTPSTSLGAVCGSTIKHTYLILLALCSSVTWSIFQSEWSKHAAICDHDDAWKTVKKKKKVLLWVKTCYFSLLYTIHIWEMFWRIHLRFEHRLLWVWFERVNLLFYIIKKLMDKNPWHTQFVQSVVPQLTLE